MSDQHHMDYKQPNQVTAPINHTSTRNTHSIQHGAFHESSTVNMNTRLTEQQNRLIQQIQLIVIELLVQFTAAYSTNQWFTTNNPLVITGTYNKLLWNNLHATHEPTQQLSHMRSMQWPSNNNNNNMTNFVRLFDVLSTIYSNIIESSYCDIRSIYYQNTRLYVTQSSCNTTVDKICKLMNCTYDDCNIYTTSRGSIYGDLQWIVDNHVVDSSINETRVPHKMSTLQFINTFNRIWLLIIEKHTVFTKLIPYIKHRDGIFSNCVAITVCIDIIYIYIYINVVPT